MRPRRTPSDQQAVARRLQMLSAELDAVRGESPSGVNEPLHSVEASAVPVPGRHSAVPTTLRGRAGIGPAQLTVVAVLVALGLAVTAWWVIRGTATPTSVSGGMVAATPLATPAGGALTTPTPPIAPTPTPTSGAATTPPAGSSVQLVVDVSGKVRSPGIAVLGPGSRVADAIKAAGGVRRGVDLSSLNLARLLVDGEQILVGVTPPPGAAASAASTATAAPGGVLVNINTGSMTDLDTLPGVGPVTAQAIIDWRTENGGFTTVDELLEVSGIGEATLADLAPLVTI